MIICFACMHAVFMGMPTAFSKGGVPLTGMQPLTTMARHTLEPACIGARSLAASQLLAALLSLAVFLTLPMHGIAWHAVTCAPISICSTCQQVPEVQQLSKDSWNSYT